MDIDKLRHIAASLPHTAETVQWGGNLVLWCADRAIGGKMFAIADLEATRSHVAGFVAGPEHYAELLERDGFLPAPHLARAHWVAMERWDALTDAEWRQELTAAHARVSLKLTRNTRAILELPAREQARLIRERRAALAKAASSPAPAKPRAAKPRPTTSRPVTPRPATPGPGKLR